MEVSGGAAEDGEGPPPCRGRGSGTMDLQGEWAPAARPGAGRGVSLLRAPLTCREGRTVPRPEN